MNRVYYANAWGGSRDFRFHVGPKNTWPPSAAKQRYGCFATRWPSLLWKRDGGKFNQTGGLRAMPQRNPCYWSSQLQRSWVHPANLHRFSSRLRSLDHHPPPTIYHSPSSMRLSFLPISLHFHNTFKRTGNRRVRVKSSRSFKSTKLSAELLQPLLFEDLGCMSRLLELLS